MRDRTRLLRSSCQRTAKPELCSLAQRTLIRPAFRLDDVQPPALFLGCGRNLAGSEVAAMDMVGEQGAASSGNGIGNLIHAVFRCVQRGAGQTWAASPMRKSPTQVSGRNANLQCDKAGHARSKGQRPLDSPPDSAGHDPTGTVMALLCPERSSLPPDRLPMWHCIRNTLIGLGDSDESPIPLGARMMNGRALGVRQDGTSNLTAGLRSCAPLPAPGP